MSDNNLVPAEEKKGRQAVGQGQRQGQRQGQGGRNIGATQGPRAVTAEEQRGAQDVVRPTSFTLPPRAELQASSSRFGFFLKVSFVLMVALPTLIATLFFAFVASDQFATESRFAVRGSSGGSSAVDLGGLFSLGSGAVDAESSDSYIVQEFIQSREMVELLIEKANFIAVYSRDSADAFYRLDPEGSIEDFVEYWRMMSSVKFDTDTGIINLRVRAFRPQDAQKLTETVIEESEKLVNDLSLRAREDSLQSARREVAIAEQRYADSRKALAAYRGDEQEIDPAATATSRQTLVGELEGELARLRSELRALKTTMSEESPRVVYVETRIEALRNQIQDERERMAEEEISGQPGLTERLSRFEELTAEREFAEKAYVSTLSALEAARMEALKQQRYLAVFVEARTPQDALYPEGIRWTLVIFGALILAWGIVALISAAVRDRVA